MTKANNRLVDITNDELLRLMEAHGSNVHIARELKVSESSVRRVVAERQLAAEMRGARERYNAREERPRGLAAAVDLDVERFFQHFRNTQCNLTQTAALLGKTRNQVLHFVRQHPELEIRMDDERKSQRDAAEAEAAKNAVALTPLESDIHEALTKAPTYTIEGLADKVDTSPKKVRQSLANLRIKGYRVPEEEERVVLEKVAPSTDNLHKSLVEGNRFLVGLVSDTHIGSKEEALPELQLAYDIFEEKGITEVWHAGDLVCGYGIFPTQAMGVKYHTFDDQVAYATEQYPFRKGIQTRMISGNHDVEGMFGRMGANPVLATCNQREDIEFLGDYSAWIELPGGAQVQLLHGKGGGSYAFSYQAQKLVDGYAPGRKPAILAVGHFHRKGNIEARGVEVLWPGCFEWQSSFLARLGLSPTVGFYILDITVGEDGTVVQFLPRWYRFFEGRKVQAIAA